MGAFRQSPAVIPCNQSNYFNLLRFKAAEVPVLNQVVGMFVMASVADVNTDVMQ